MDFPAFAGMTKESREWSGGKTTTVPGPPTLDTALPSYRGSHLHGQRSSLGGGAGYAGLMATAKGGGPEDGGGT